MSERPLNAAEQVAEAHGPTHPTVVDRVSKEAVSFARMLDGLDAATMAADDPWEALETLAESVHALRSEAEMHRPHVT